jgi:spore germination protein YaaH
MSKLVITSTGLSAPQAPTSLTATDAGGGGYQVSWRAAVAGSSPIRGYRVFRDGIVVGQGPETSRLVTGLEAGTAYRIEVQTFDSRGEASPLSAPLNLTLAPPVPTAGHGRAFLLASTDRSFEDLQANYMKIGRVYPTYYDCAPDGTFLGKDDPRITRWAQARRIQVLPRINCQRTAVQHRIFTDPVMRQRWIDQIVEVTRTNGYEGVNIDFEAGLASDRAVFSEFITLLTARMHAEGRIVSLCVSPKINDNSLTHPRSGIFDYPALSAQADEMMVMGWGVHWLTSPAGQLSPLSWIHAAATYAASMPNANRFVMGAAMYGVDWPAGSSASRPGTALEYDDMQVLIAAKGAVPQRDPGSGEMFFQYTDASGVVHDVRYLDVETIQAKHAAAAAGGIRQTFLWRLGDEDQRIWTLPSVSGL